MKKVKVVCLLVFCLALCSSVSSAQVISFNASEIAKMKELISSDTSAANRYEKISKDAKSALGASPHPIVKISTAGRLKGDTVREETNKATKDFYKIWCLAVSYSFTGDELYLRQAIKFILAWAEVNMASGEPINETKLDPVLEAYDIVRSKIANEEKQKIENWLRSIADAEINGRIYGTKTAVNNWNSHRIKIVGLIGFAIGDEKYKTYAESALKEQIKNNLLEDGSSWDFKERDALHYHCYDIEPLLKISIAFKRTGKDYYKYISDNNSSLEKSVSFLKPYLSGIKYHEEFVNSNVNFDKRRSDNNQEAYKTGRKFEAKQAVQSLELAEYFDPSLLEVIKGINTNFGIFSSFRLLINEATR